MCLISVVIPTYNRAHTLSRAILSVIHQTYQKFEVIVVDDASADDTADIVSSIPDQRVKYIRLKKNSGVSAARNAGLDCSNGEFIAFLDSDDEWLPQKLEKQIAIMRDHSNDWGVCHTGAIILKDGHRVINFLASTHYTGNVYIPLILSKFTFFTPTLLLRKASIDMVGGFDTELRQGEDGDLLMRILNRYKLEAISEPLAIFHLDTIKVSPDNTYMSQLKIIANHKQEIQKIGNFCFRRWIGQRYWIIADRFLRSGNFKLGIKYMLKSLYQNPFKSPKYIILLILISTGLLNRLKRISI